MKYILNIDWLSFFCQGTPPKPFSVYTLEELPFGTPVFSRVANLVLNNEVKAQVLWCPRSSVLGEYSMMIKINNRILYTNEWCLLLTDIRFAWGLSQIKISRLDICADFQFFKFGLSAPKHIQNFIEQKTVKVGKAKFKLIGEQRKMIEYQYLRFGEGSSPVSVYLYNKTIELMQVKDKPYIREQWRAAGFDNKNHVWRLEFSLKGKALKIIDKKTGEFVTNDFAALTYKNVLQSFFSLFLNKYFTFKRCEVQQNKFRWEKIVLFDSAPTDFEIVDISMFSDTSRKHKIFLKQLFNLEKSMRALKPYQKQVTDELIFDYATEHNLLGYTTKISSRGTHFE